MTVKMEFQETVVEIKNLNKSYKRVNSLKHKSGLIPSVFNRKKKVKALNDINISINKGDTYGIIGRNGSGKTTLLNIIMGSIRADKDSYIETKGKIIRLALGLGMDPNLSGRDNIYVNGSVLGLSFRKIGSLYDEIVEFAGLQNFIESPVKFYSSGMKQRLMFSIAMYAPANIFLLDEFFGGTGDSAFKKKSEIMFKKRILEGKTILVVSHSMAIITKYCNKCIWLHNGSIKLIGETNTVIDAYRNFNKTNNQDKIGGNI